MVDRDRTAITYRYECRRALSAGIIEAAGRIFLLLIAVRWFDAGPLAKAVIATSRTTQNMLTGLR